MVLDRERVRVAGPPSWSGEWREIEVRSNRDLAPEVLILGKDTGRVIHKRIYIFVLS
jgi:hypothetical protein